MIGQNYPRSCKTLKNGPISAKFMKAKFAKIEVLVTWKFIHVIPY